MTKKIWIGIFVTILAAFALLSGKFWHVASQVAEAATPKAPELIGGDQDWVNTPGGKAFQLYGSNGILNKDPNGHQTHDVILIDFWEYTCINCLHTLPYIKQWAKLYAPDGLVVIGIHSPEFKFAHDPANVRAAVKRLGITYPVLIDSDYNNWNAYNNDSWPADFILDSQGHIVDTNQGEGDYSETEDTLRHLLLKANPGETLPAAYGDPADLSGLSSDITPELYAGSSRGQIQNLEGFANGETTNYASIPTANWSDGNLVVSGEWRFDDEYAESMSHAASSYVGVKYHAKSIVAVIKPDSTAPPMDIIVTQDGQPVAKSDAGLDIHYMPDGRSYLHVDAAREYDITRNAVPGSHVLQLYPSSTQFKLYSFCFSGI